MFWQQIPVERAARHIIAGYPIKIEELAKLVPTAQALEQPSYCRPAAMRGSAIVRLRLAEEFIAAGERDQIDSSMNSLRNSIRRSLVCSPADSFLWLAYFWVENTLNGFSVDHLKYLRMSYRLGSNEGWIALKRNRISLAIFESLPPDLAEMALDEFATLLGSEGSVNEAVAIFTGPGWRIRSLLLPRLKNVDDFPREAFARALYIKGYDVEVPGVKRIEARPWD
jgi:hypothetical protein